MDILGCCYKLDAWVDMLNYSQFLSMYTVNKAVVSENCLFLLYHQSSMLHLSDLNLASIEANKI